MKSLKVLNLVKRNLDIDKNDINFTLSEPITLEHGVLKGAQITLESAEIAEIFKINYNSCVSKNECYSVYEVLQAPFYGNYDKALLKLKLSISDGSGYNNIAFITSFGEVVYKINGQIKTINIQKQLSPVKVKSQSNYFEIPKEVLNSDYVMLNFYVRNQKYTYQIR